MVLVTGGTGLVGSHLLFNLANAGIKVRAIYRNEDRIRLTEKVFGYYTDEPNVLIKTIEWVKCTLNDLPTLENVFEDITHVYHCAALISFDPNNKKKLSKTNVEGSFNIANLCITYKVKKLCYVSSIATIGNTVDGKLANENTAFNTTIANDYAQSKHQAEMEVWRASQEGVDVIVINPGVIVGPGFWDNGSGSIFKKIYSGLSFYPPGNTGFVSVSDVVNSLTLLMNSNCVNQRYILVSKNIPYKEAFTTIALALDKKPPKRLIKKWMLTVFWRLDWVKSNLLDSERILTKKMAASFAVQIAYSNEKIKKDIGFEFEDLEASIQSCASIFLQEYH